MKEPWICPICKKVNAPWLPFCCKLKQIDAPPEFEEFFKQNFDKLLA